MSALKIPHFLDLPPCYQIDVLALAISKQTPLISCYAWSFLSSFRKYIRETQSPFEKASEAESVYYGIRSCLTVTHLHQRIKSLVSSGHALSDFNQCQLVELVEDVLIAAVDDCLWTDALQMEMDVLMQESRLLTNTVK